MFGKILNLLVTLDSHYDKFTRASDRTTNRGVRSCHRLLKIRFYWANPGLFFGLISSFQHVILIQV